MVEQQRAQQALMTLLIDQQREEMARYRRELEELREQESAVAAVRPRVQKVRQTRRGRSSVLNVRAGDTCHTTVPRCRVELSTRR